MKTNIYFSVRGRGHASEQLYFDDMRKLLKHSDEFGKIMVTNQLNRQKWIISAVTTSFTITYLWIKKKTPLSTSRHIFLEAWAIKWGWPMANWQHLTRDVKEQLIMLVMQAFLHSWTFIQPWHQFIIILVQKSIENRSQQTAGAYKWWYQTQIHQNLDQLRVDSQQLLRFC